MKPKHRRALWLTVAFLSFAAGVSGLLSVFNDNIVFFFSPTEVMAKDISPEQRIRVGGLIVKGSVVKKADVISFTVTDGANTLAIEYRGLPPNLFKEGVGIVAEGFLTPEGFKATNLLAKHDENYMPPEVAKSLKESGHWKDQYGKKAGAAQ